MPAPVPGRKLSMAALNLDNGYMLKDGWCKPFHTIPRTNWGLLTSQLVPRSLATVFVRRMFAAFINGNSVIHLRYCT